MEARMVAKTEEVNVVRREPENSPTADAALKAALDTFERSLISPIISGDMVGWFEEVEESWREAASQIHFQTKHLHPRRYEEIAQQDSELLPRIDLLKAEDGAIEAEREKFNQGVSRLAEHIPKLEPDEEKAQKYTNTLSDEGVAFIARIRKQAVAVQTWYIEAFNRDRGAVD
jgi:hypothetical protein